MFGVLYIMFVGLGAVLAHKREGMSTCLRNMHNGGLQCCKKDMPGQHMPPPDDINECIALPKKPPPSCEMEICIAQKRGVGKSDGSFDEEAMAKSFKSKFPNDPELISNIITNCVKGDLTNYGPADMCDLMKLKHCIVVEVIKSCDEWDDEGDCNGMQDLAEECVKEFA